MTYLIVILLLLASGLFSGLNLGLMSLEPNELRRKAKLGDKNAKKVYPIRAKGNQLLVTIILCNVALNSILAVFLGSITEGIVAVILATALITIFGEILPQSIISRFALPFGARTAKFVSFVMVVLSPICRPIAYLLDKVLGQELTRTYTRRELIEIIGEHGDNQNSDIREDEERIASGALSFGSKLVDNVMTPRSVVSSLVEGQILDEKTINKLVVNGFSRVPITNSSNNKVVGILYIRELLDKDFKNSKVDEFIRRQVHYLNERDSLDIALKYFIKTKQHLAVVVNEFAEYIGVITLEDVLEDIIGQEIVDEFDEHKDLREVARELNKKNINTN